MLLKVNAYLGDDINKPMSKHHDEVHHTPNADKPLAFWIHQEKEAHEVDGAAQPQSLLKTNFMW